MASEVDPSICPTCREPNGCGLMQGKTECWCFAAKIPSSNLDAIPPEAKETRCICARCAARELLGEATP